jgi:hypothetical protein|tara:strand:- start:289 stop:663 length:375 start_codon:yes stop_codon:yes gene_type:complete
VKKSKKEMFAFLRTTTVLIFFSLTVSATVPLSERNALVELYTATEGPKWSNGSTWLIGDPCLNNWFGIFCDADDTHVIEVFPNPRHSGNIMKGAIPHSFWTDLPMLEQIYLSNDIPFGASSLTG